MRSRIVLLCSKLNPKIPKIPVRPVQKSGEVEKFRISASTLKLLQQLSLIRIGDQEAVDRIQEAVKFVEPLKEVNVEGVRPLDSVLEDERLRLRDDEVKMDNDKEDILMNAAEIEEDYFVAPPGNIPAKFGDIEVKRG